MITASKYLIEFLENQSSIVEYANRIDVAPTTLYNVLKGKDVSSDVVAKILNGTGLKFDSAFEVAEDEKWS